MLNFTLRALMDLIMQKTSHFGSHFEFRHFTNLKHHLMQKITPDSDSTPNLAIEKPGFVYYFEKRFECAHPYQNISNILKNYDYVNMWNWGQFRENLIFCQ